MSKSKPRKIVVNDKSYTYVIENKTTTEDILMGTENVREIRIYDGKILHRTVGVSPVTPSDIKEHIKVFERLYY